MPRTNREETKEKKVPFKKCAGPNCSNRCEFYDSGSFCRNCKLNFFFNEAINIKLLKDKIDRIKQLKEELERIRVETPNIWKRFFEWYHKQTLTPTKNKHEDEEIYINMDKDSHLSVIAYQNVPRLPNIKRFYFNWIPECNEDLRLFLIFSSPINPSKFVFGWEAKGLFKIDYYLDGLEHAVREITGEIFVCNWNFSKMSFERFVKASANCSKLVIRHSKLDCEQDLDFSGPSYKINYLSLERCGDCWSASCGNECNGDDWSADSSKIKKIIKAISKSSMKDSLQTLNINKSGTTYRIVKYFLEEYEMPNVKVVEQENYP